MSARDIRLKRRAVACLKNNTFYHQGQKLVVPSKYIYKGVWNWDSMFHALAISRWNIDLAISQIKYFIDRQDEKGMYCDAFLFDGVQYDTISKPPVVAWVLNEIIERNGLCFDLKFFYNSLKKNIAFWENFRKRDELFKYDSFVKNEEYLMQCRNESGWDNSVRWDLGAQNIWAIDLNCYIAYTYFIMSKFASTLNILEEKTAWINKFNELSKNINEKLWCEEIQAYCDYNFTTNQFNKVLSPASFMPLFVKIAPTDRAEKMKEVAEDNRKFYPYFPTVSYDSENYSETDYWRGPTWLNVAYFAMDGLRKYGYEELYQSYKENILNMVDNEKRGLFEYYNSKTGKGLGAKQFSWSAVFILEMLKEIEFNG